MSGNYEEDLDDLDDLDVVDENDVFDDLPENEEANGEATQNSEFQSNSRKRKTRFEGDSEEEDDEEDEEEDANENLPNIDDVLATIVEKKTSGKIGILRNSTRYNKILSEVEDNIEKPSLIGQNGLIENDPEYKLILQCNKIIQDIDEDITSTYLYVCGIYAEKFPELQGLIHSKIDYARVIKVIGNETDMTEIDFGDILTPNLVMVVSVSGSSTVGKTLTEEKLKECFKGCDEILSLNSDKMKILKYIESRISRIAPNMCALIGSRVSAQMIGLAGGLVALSRIPACNIQVLGQERRHASGFSGKASMSHIGSLYYSDLVQSCPSYLRKKALKLVAAKIALISRVDTYKNHPDGSEGYKFRKDVEDKINKWQEPEKARTKRALPIPDEKKRKSKRGGKRVKRMKERFAMTDIRTQQNRLIFSTDVGEYGDSAMGLDGGMIGLKEGGKMRGVQVKQAKLLKAGKNRFQSSNNNNAAASGLASTLSFTPYQGMELVGPAGMSDKVKEANSKWFSSNSGFMSAIPK